MARISLRAKRVRKVLTLPLGTSRSISRLVSAGYGKGCLLSTSERRAKRLSSHQRVLAPLARQGSRSRQNNTPPVRRYDHNFSTKSGSASRGSRSRRCQQAIADKESGGMVGRFSRKSSIRNTVLLPSLRINLGSNS